MYTLYHSKSSGIIQVSKAKPTMQNIGERYYTEDIEFYNSNYYTCLRKNPLMEQAEKMKTEWINEAKETLKKYEDIKL